MRGNTVREFRFVVESVAAWKSKIGVAHNFRYQTETLHIGDLDWRQLRLTR